MIHVALLRGINVGGRNKLAMAKLREIAEGCGFEDVKSYVQSGNLVFSAAKLRGAPVAALLREAILEQARLDVAVMVRTRRELAAVVAANPFANRVGDPTKLHVVFWDRAPRPSPLAALDLAVYAPEEARLVAGHLYLYLPEGMGRSRLAADLSRRKGPSGTARNWRTVTNLLGMADGL
jgi:uncharacterized protein (DUF1697 family)